MVSSHRPADHSLIAFITITTRTRAISCTLRQSLTSKWSLETCHIIHTKRAITLKTQSYSTKWLDLKTNSLERNWRRITSRALSHMSGTSCGVAHHANHTSMKDLMNTKRSIISLRVMKSLVKIVSASILSVCKRDLARTISTLCLILTFYPMNLEISTIIIKSLNKANQERTFGLLSQLMHARVEVSTWLTILMMSMLMRLQLFASMWQILCW